MSAIIDPILENLKSGNVHLVIVTILIAILFNFRNIYRFFEEIKKSKIGRLEAALKCSQIDGKSKLFLEDQIENEHFNLATGVRVEKEFREKILEIHSKTNGELSFIHFKRALPYMIFKNSVLNIKISPFDKFIHLFNWVISFVMVALGIIMFLIFSQSNNSTPAVMFQFFMLGVVCFLISVFIIFQTFPVRSAKWVKEELLKQQINS